MEDNSYIQNNYQETEPKGLGGLVGVLKLLAVLGIFLVVPAIALVLYYRNFGVIAIMVGIIFAFIGVMLIISGAKVWRTKSGIFKVLLAIILFVIAGGSLKYGHEYLQWKTVYTAHISGFSTDKPVEVQFNVPNDLTASTKEHTLEFHLLYQNMTPDIVAHLSGHIAIHFSHPGGSFDTSLKLPDSSLYMQDYRIGRPIDYSSDSNYSFILQPGTYTFTGIFTGGYLSNDSIPYVAIDIKEHR